jgi:hypothetical protein
MLSDDANNTDWANSMSALLTGLLTATTTTSSSSSSQTTKGSVDNVIVDNKEKNDPAEIIREDPICKTPQTMTDGDQIAQLEGNRRWYIRKAVSLSEPVIITPESLNQALAIEDSTKLAVKVDGKISAILAGERSLFIPMSSYCVDKCKQLDLEVGDVVSSIELLGCTKVRLFLTGEAHIVVLDGCEAVQIYLSAASQNVKIVTSKCTEINIVIPANLIDPSLNGDEAEESVELPVPVQFFSHLQDGKLITSPHEHVGA